MGEQVGLQKSGVRNLEVDEGKHQSKHRVEESRQLKIKPTLAEESRQTKIRPTFPGRSPSQALPDTLA